MRTFSVDPGRLAVGGLFLAIAAALAWAADPSLGFGPDQTAYNAIAEGLLVAWDRGAALETEFGSLARQSFVVLLAAGQRLLGDLISTYRAILFLSALAYLCSMYVLLRSVLGERTVAAATSVLSIVQRYTLGTSFWGMGEFQTILPRIVVLWVFPLAWLVFERHLGSRGPARRRVLEAFAILGLAVTIHLSSVYFYFILLATYALYEVGRRAGSSTLSLLIATALAFFAMATVPCPGPLWSAAMDEAGLPGALVTLAGFGLVFYFSRLARGPSMGVVALLYLCTCLGLMLWLQSEIPPRSVTFGTAVGAGDLEAVNAAIRARFGWTLFPISAATLGFVAYSAGIAGAVALYEFVRRWRREAGERERITALFAVSALALALGLTAAIQLYCRLAGRPIMIFELFRATRMIFLPIYIYVGLFLSRVWRRVRERRDLRGGALLAALIVALLVPPRQALAALPDAFKLWAREAAQRAGALDSDDPSQRQYLETLLATGAEIAAARARYRDFLDLCDWVRRSTPERSLFMTTDYRFIHHAGRDIMISYPQGAGSARSMTLVAGFPAWHEAFVEISGAYASRSAARIMAAARRYEVDYVVAQTAQPPLPAPVVYANRSFTLYRRAP